MAADLDRAGRGSGGPAGRAGVIQAGRRFLQDWRHSSGVLGFICRAGWILLQGPERILSFFVILLSVFDMFGIDC